MNYEEIVQSVCKLKEKFSEDDPVRLCAAMGISVLYQPMGKHNTAIKGFALRCKRIFTITINSDLPEIIQKIIVAHELCHVIHHKTSLLYAFHELALFDETSSQEKDASLFSAELLLDDQDVFEALNEDTTFFATAATLRVPIELLDFKFRAMKWKGYKLVEPPLTADGNFLRNMEVPEDADLYF